MQHLEFIQILPVNLKVAWDFFSNPSNLKGITPPYMNFRIINDLPEVFYEGMFIEYRVAPLAGISMEWITEITHIRAPYFFIDEQRIGPYAIWHHEHHFEETPGGIKMTDKLYYSLPFGFPGKFIDKLIVKNKVMDIFRYRNQKITSLFVNSTKIY